VTDDADGWTPMAPCMTFRGSGSDALAGASITQS
jgi:hypothetical protein